MNPSPPPLLELLVTDACTLCDQAFDWLAGAPEVRGHTLHTIDIAPSDDLMERYGERIPVLRCGAGELDWPFTREALADLLRSAD